MVTVNGIAAGLRNTGTRTRPSRGRVGTRTGTRLASLRHVPIHLVSIKQTSIALLIALLSAACSPAPGADVTAGQIIENPTFYVGQSLTVSGRVEHVHGPRAFTIDSGMQDGDLLVIGAEPFADLPALRDERGAVDGDYTALVTGTVRLFVASAIEREIGRDVDPEIEATFANKSVIISHTTQFERK